MRIECLPGSTLPEELRAAGYDLEPDGEGERIVPSGHHAGIVRVERYGFAFAD
jgi:hypothetical protein